MSTRFDGASRWLGLPMHWRPSTLSEGALRELWRFRVSIMGLRPETDPEDDYAAFRTCLQRCEFVWVDEAGGDIVGMYAFVLRALEHEGERVAIWEGEYVCVSPRHRKGWKLIASVVASLAYMRLRHRGHRPYVFGAAYLPSFLVIHHAGPAYLHDDPRLSERDRRLLLRLASEYRTWDPKSGTIALPTRPVAPRLTPPRDPSLHEPWRRFLAHNPRWYEGHASAVLQPLEGLGAHVVRRGVRLGAQRLLVRRPVDAEQDTR